MRIVNRDVEVMGWILEQKYMTIEQVERVFWRDIAENNTEASRRLSELQKAGYLKRSRTNIYRKVLYIVTGSGLRMLKSYGRDRGLDEVYGFDYLNFKHDVVVTDIRIIFHEMGYSEWISERVLSKRNDLRRLPDGMIHHKGKYFAIEYESTQKSKNRYRDIFLKYEIDGHIDKVIYVVDVPELVTKLGSEAAIYDKLHFVVFRDLQEQRLNAHLRSSGGQKTLFEILER